MPQPSSLIMKNSSYAFNINKGGSRNRLKRSAVDTRGGSRRSSAIVRISSIVRKTTVAASLAWRHSRLGFSKFMIQIKNNKFLGSLQTFSQFWKKRDCRKTQLFHSISFNFPLLWSDCRFKAKERAIVRQIGPGNAVKCCCCRIPRTIENFATLQPKLTQK